MIWLVLSVVLTLLIEAIIAIGWGFRNKKQLIVIILANLITNPLLNSALLLIDLLIGFRSLALLLLLESLVIGGEYLIYVKALDKDKRSLLRFVIVANLTTLILGLCLEYIVGFSNLL